LEAERLERLGLYINLDDDDDVGPSSMPPNRRTHGDPGQGCSSFLPPLKQEPNDDKEEDCVAAMYRCLGLGRGGYGGY
jgi:hypothetical protein